jgi:hypothetical protein
MTAATLSHPVSAAPPYLKNRGFDQFFVLGIPLIALLTAAYLLAWPEHFNTVLWLDLTLLGYHHVISTYTRLVFDWQSAREHWVLLLPLPIAVAAATIGIAFYWGLPVIATIYLHWQWYHYTRQSEGINKAYGGKTRSVQGGHAGFNRFVFYLVPVAGLLMLSARPDATFLGMTVLKLPVPQWLALGAMAATTACLLLWLANQVQALRAGTLRPLHFAYLCSHIVIYMVSYVFIADISTGWVVINVWHNAQYIAFVWLFNSNRHKGGVDRKRPVISWMSQERHWPIYLCLCLWITNGVYYAIGAASSYFASYSLVPLVVVVYQAINFHHYIVDSQIWKLRSPKVQAAL